MDLPQNKEEKEQGTVLNALQKGEIFAGLAAVVLIFAITAANILLPDKEFSEKENRMLAEKPEIFQSAGRALYEAQRILYGGSVYVARFLDFPALAVSAADGEQ